jgi:hypothetical protein
MIKSTVLALSLLPLALACQTTATVAPADAARRAALFGAVASLEGRWEGGTPTEGLAPLHEFRVTSAGSAVRELMFPGSEHEMTNMYTLDGDGLVMTHYCAAGNQPHMRATSIDGDAIAFRTTGVSDLKAPDEVYMGEMTLVLVDENHIEQRWRALRAGRLDDEMVFELHRVP